MESTHSGACDLQATSQCLSVPVQSADNESSVDRAGAHTDPPYSQTDASLSASNIDIEPRREPRTSFELPVQSSPEGNVRSHLTQNIRATTIQSVTSRESIRPEAQSDWESMRDAQNSVGEQPTTSDRGRPIARDLESGTRDGSLSSGSSASEAQPLYAARPTMTIIDVDSTGACAHRGQQWTKDSKQFQESIPEQPINSIRIVLTELGEYVLLNISDDEEDIVCDGLLDEETGNLSRLWKVFFASRFMPASIMQSLARRRDLDELSSTPDIAVHGSERFSVWRLQELLRWESNGSRQHPFIIQANFEGSSFPGTTKIPQRSVLLAPQLGDSSAILLKPSLFSDPQRLCGGVGGMSVEFWESIAGVTIKQVDNSRIQVSCSFPALLFANIPTEPSVNCLSPVQKEFETLLLSEQSALKFCNNDKILTCKLVILDLLRASMQVWRTFFNKVSRCQVEEFTLTATLEDYQKDIAVTARYVAAIRDLSACVSYLISSIQATLDYNSQVSVGPARESLQSKADWDTMILELHASNQALQGFAKDIQEHSDRAFSFFMASSNNRQAQSLKHLTLVASVFLPLTLASSVLAMNTHAAKLGDLWYDWVGLWLILGFAVIAMYSAWQKTERVCKHWRVARLCSSTWFKIFLCLLSSVVVASFLAGIFGTKKLALEVLEYGIPGAVAFAVLFTPFIGPFIYILIRICTVFANMCFAFMPLLRQLHRRGGKLEDLMAFTATGEEIDGADSVVAAEARRRVLQALAANERTRRYVERQDWLPHYIQLMQSDRRPEMQEILESIRTIAAEDPEIRSMLRGVI